MITNLKTLLKELADEFEVGLRDEKTEEFIFELVTLQKAVERKLDMMKAQLVMTQEKDLSSYTGKRLRYTFFATGGKYGVDPSTPEDYVITEIKIKPDTKKIEEYLKEFRELPTGVSKKDRKTALSIKILDDTNETYPETI